MPEISVVVPVLNEEENILPLIAEINNALKDKYDFEIIYVNDGSTDNTLEKLKFARKTFSNLRILTHQRKCGQSAAFRTGVLHAKSPVIATLDGDGQNDPANIPAMYELYKTKSANSNLRLVAGHRAHRQDSLNKKISSKLANAIRKAMLRDNTPDTGCGLKVFSREDYLLLPFFDHIHRYMPALFIREGFSLESFIVNHRPRERGISKYGFWNRALVGITDLLGVMWLIRRMKRSAVVEE